MKKTDDETQFIKSTKTKIAEFVSKNAVYGIFAVVLIAVCTITILSLPASDRGTVDVSPSPSQVADNNPPASNSPSLRPSNTPSNNRTPGNPTPTPDQSGNNTPTPPATTPPVGPGDEDVSGKPSTSFSLVLPFEKKSIITSYSNDTPIYSETLNEWACHVGIDFKCSAGDSVAAAADGIVVSITTDDLYGTSILVQHSDDFYTLYRGLDAASVAVDELVAQGQSLGTAAESIPFEAHMDTHIHFEVIKDNLSVNPLSFVK